MGRLALTLSAFALAVARTGSAGAAVPEPVQQPLSAPQQQYLALAQSGVAHAEQRWSNHRGWYNARLGDRDHYPLATIWDIVPLFQSLDAIAIAQPTAANKRALTRFGAGAERYLNRGLHPMPGYSPYPGDRTANTETWFDDNGWWGLALVIDNCCTSGRERTQS